LLTLWLFAHRYGACMSTNLSGLHLKADGFAKGTSGSEVHAVQTYLRHYGYIQDVFGALHDGDFDDVTEKAIRLYQNYFGLPETGVLDEASLCEMAKPRCGFRDIPPLGAAFTTVSRWDKSRLTYKFNNFSTKLTQSDIERDTAKAFKLWSDHCALVFVCEPKRKSVDIDIAFATGDHGDDAPFDGPSGVLAHAYFPPPNGGPFAGDAHFDDDERWTCGMTETNGIDFLTVAAHEFGHAIGLGHSRQRAALMFPSYSGPHRFLDQDDIAGCQALYGSPVTA